MSKQDKILARRRQQQPCPHLDDVTNAKKLRQAVNADLVKVVPHPTLPLRLYCYTTLRFTGWNQTIRQARGLCVTSDQHVTARPFEKYFGPAGNGSLVPKYPLESADEISEKLDGTMIVASNHGNQIVLSTKASFDAPQLAAARHLIPEDAVPEAGTTWVFEYVSPDNPHVVEYTTERLVLLSVRDNWTGVETVEQRHQVAALHGFELPATYDPATFRLADWETDPTIEGFVATWYSTKRPPHRIKVKTGSYYERRDALFASTPR